MKTRYILFYHGHNKQLVEKIASFCEKIESDVSDDAYMFNGSLDEFEAHYGGNFMVRNAPHASYISVTQHNTFGAR